VVDMGKQRRDYDQNVIYFRAAAVNPNIYLLDFTLVTLYYIVSGERKK
jgi:hypothetical protein